jgi:PleD family two-component response regulator
MFGWNDNRTKREGLAISKRIIEMHGGKSGSSRSRVKAPPLPSRSPSSSSGRWSRQHEQRILVMEGQKDNRQIVRDMLAGTDYEITEAEDGEHALAAVAKQRPISY